MDSNLALWCKSFSEKTAYQSPGRDFAAGQYVQRGGHDVNTGGFGRWIGNTFNPGGMRSRDRLDLGYRQSMTDLAKRYESQGMSTENALRQAQRDLGSRSDFRTAVDDQAYRQGSWWQHMFTPRDDMLRARAKAMVQGGAWSPGGSWVSLLHGWPSDYFGGQQRQQEQAASQARRVHGQHMGHLASDIKRRADRTPSTGFMGGRHLTDLDQHRRNVFAQQYGSAPSAANAALQQQALTGDWRRDRGWAGLMPFLGSGHQGRQSVLESDIQHATRGNWGDFSRIARPFQRFGHYLTGSEYSPHSRLLASNPAYREQIDRISKGEWSPMDDLSAVQWADPGRTAHWLSPVRYVPQVFGGSPGRTGRREGADLSAVTGTGDFRQIMGELRSGRLAPEEAARLRHNLSSIRGRQREGIGLDKAFEAGEDPRTRRQASLTMALSDAAKQNPRIQEAIRDKLRAQDAADAAKEAQVMEKRAYSYWYPRQHRPKREPVFNREQQQQMAADLAAMLQHRQNPYRQDHLRDRDLPAHRLAWGSMMRPFMSEADILKRDPGFRWAQSAIQGGGWRPGMDINHLARGTGYRAIGGITDALGITTSPEEQRRQLIANMRQSSDYQELIKRYQQGDITPEGYRKATGVSMLDAYANDPEALLQKQQKATRARMGHAFEDLKAQAADTRQRALGSKWDSMLR